MAGKKARVRRARAQVRGRARAAQRREQRWLIVDVIVRSIGIVFEMLRR